MQSPPKPMAQAAKGVMAQREQEQKQERDQDVTGFIEDLRSRILFENLAQMVTKCTQSCVTEYDEMYLNNEEEQCVRKCYLKSFDFQNTLN